MRTKLWSGLSWLIENKREDGNGCCLEMEVQPEVIGEQAEVVFHLARSRKRIGSRSEHYSIMAA